MVKFSLEMLDKIIAERAEADAGQSYTAGLLASGPSVCARKLGEEGIETVIAAMEGNRAALTSEAADLLYHLLVLLRSGGVPLASVMEELHSRTARSGLVEKAARSGNESAKTGER